MKVAVVGATGLVGTVMLKVLEERNFPVTELIPVASERSIGTEITFKGKKFKVVSAADAIAKKPNIALFSAGGEYGPPPDRLRAVREHIVNDAAGFQRLLRDQPQPQVT